MARLTATRLPAAALLLAFISGCGSDEAKLAAVRGTVSYRGTPLHGGTIVFTPDTVRGDGGPIARAEIQSDGTYLLKTGPFPGATPGWHRVTVVSLEQPAPGSGGRPHSLLPSRYHDPEQSGLSFQVRPGTENVFNIDLD
jgi:hypothetical protein